MKPPELSLDTADLSLHGPAQFKRSGFLSTLQRSRASSDNTRASESCCVHRLQALRHSANRTGNRKRNDLGW